MKREPIDSEVIASMGYDPTWKVLEIEFGQTREIYDYFAVSPEDYAEFRSAASKGAYLNNVFESRNHRYERVE